MRRAAPSPWREEEGGARSSKRLGDAGYWARPHLLRPRLRTDCRKRVSHGGRGLWQAPRHGDDGCADTAGHRSRRCGRETQNSQIVGMNWFKSGDLLDRAFAIGIILKGLDGVLEVVVDLLLLVVTPTTLHPLSLFLPNHPL